MHLRKTLKVLAWIGGIAVVMAGVGYGGLQLTLAHFYPDPPARTIRSRRVRWRHSARISTISKS
jgi:hypothetical protein